MRKAFLHWGSRISRRARYHGQRWVVLLQGLVPRRLRQILKSSYRKLVRAAGWSRLEAALGVAAGCRSDYAIVCFPIIDWRWRIQRPQHLLAAVAQSGHRVFYVRTDFEPGHDAALELLAPNIFGLRLPGPWNIDISASEFPSALLEIWLKALDDLRTSQQIGEAVCLVHLPFWGPLALAARHRWGWPVVYDCMDELAEFASTHPSMLAHEQPLIADSDLVVTTAQALYARCAPRASKCILLPNAADFEHFKQPTGRKLLPDLRGPVIGYYGAVSDWFEPQFVRAAALAHPEWQFVLIGLDPWTRLTALERLPNVHLLGEQPYSILPDYLHRFDAVIIPFKINALTRATNPVKFYEYLSAGKPLVAVDLPELQPFRRLFYPASGLEDFVRQLESAVAERDPAKPAARIAMARENTWEHRSRALDSELRDLYPAVTVAVVGSHRPTDLRHCLESIWASTEYPNFGLVVIDDGSSAEVSRLVQAAAHDNRRLSVIECRGAASLAQAGNAALAGSRADYAVLLSSDTQVLRGWLTGLIRHLEDGPQAGMVGAVVDWWNGPANSVGLDLETLEAYAGQKVRAPRGTRREVRALEMVCVALRRKAYDDTGSLNEGYTDGVAASLDYCLRLRRAGYLIYRAEDVCVHHWGWASNGAMARADVQEFLAGSRSEPA